MHLPIYQQWYYHPWVTSASWAQNRRSGAYFMVFSDSFASLFSIQGQPISRSVTFLSSLLIILTSIHLICFSKGFWFEAPNLVPGTFLINARRPLSSAFSSYLLTTCIMGSGHRRFDLIQHIFFLHWLFYASSSVFAREVHQFCWS